MEELPSLNKFYNLFFFKNIDIFKSDLNKYCEVLDYEVKINDSEFHDQYIIEGIAIFNIYYDGTVKIIEYNNTNTFGIPLISNQDQKYYKITQDKLFNIHNTMLDILNYVHNENNIREEILKLSKKIKIEYLLYKDRHVYRYKRGYCFEFNNNGFRILYSSRLLNTNIYDSNGNIIPKPHPQYDFEYNNPEIPLD